MAKKTSAKPANETEIKLELPSANKGRQLLKKAGFEITEPRAFEANMIYDTADLTLSAERKLLRLREVGKDCILTFKGPPGEGRHKSREERETHIMDAGALEAILGNLGYSPMFRYEKYRAEFKAPRGKGTAMLDETPIGCYLELEGPPDWIDRTAAKLGFLEKDYITASYGGLYVEYCRARGYEPTHMVFDHPKRKSGKARKSKTKKR